MTTTIQRVTLPDDARILMASDLHGHGEGLRSLLEEVGFHEKDMLILLGDYVDKGPASLHTLRYVMDLCSKYTVYALMGNTDYWRLSRLLSDDPEAQRQLVHYSLKAQGWWHTSFFGELLAEIGEPLTADMDTPCVFARLREHFAPEIAFLQSLPTILETQSIIFVHGGIPHERLHELEGTPCQPLMKWDHFMEDGLSFGKYVAVGHWPVALYSKGHPSSNPIIDHRRHILSLDGGCGLKTDGQLNLVSIPHWRSTDFELHAWNPMPKIAALNDQPEMASCAYIHWGDHAVDVVEHTQPFARILHHGREMRVPASFLWQQNGQWYCDDVTDYRPQIAAGDRLSLILETPEGCYIKKNGLTGWYTGRYIAE